MKNQEKIARLCWNTKNWIRPSGKEGKSVNKKANENTAGYGHEEWLFDKSKLIEGFHYGCLASVKQDCHVEDKFNISFYTIDGNTKQRWWLGKINDVCVISKEEAIKIYSKYKVFGWLKEMAEQVKNVAGDLEDFKETKPWGFFNVKYKPEEVYLFDTPLPISNHDKAITASYYVLLNKKREPSLGISNKFVFRPGFNSKKQKTRARYGKKETDVDLLHNKIEIGVCSQIAELKGKECVGSNNDCGCGTQIDIAEKDNNSYVFYEIKTSHSLKLCIRDAVGQLLEYAYFPSEKRARKLIIVSHNKINDDAEKYLKFLRKRFDLPIYYRYFNIEKNHLEEIEY